MGSSYLQLLLIDKKIQEVLPLLNQAGHLVDSWAGSPHQKEYLKVFFLVLQVVLKTKYFFLIFNMLIWL